MRHRRFDVARLRIDGADIALRYADLVLAEPEGTDDLQWECIVVPRDHDRLSTGAHALAADTTCGRTLAGDAVLVRSVHGSHVLRGAGPLTGVGTDDLV
jgi:hypothetical protein